MPAILQGLDLHGYDVPAADWAIQQAMVTETGVAVIIAGPAGQPPRLVVKLPQTTEARASLLRQRAVQTTLHADPRLADWRHLLPGPIAEGTQQGQYFVVEQALHGHTAMGILSEPALRTSIQTAAAIAAHQLHQRTGELVAVDATVLRHWIDDPLAHLQHAHRRMLPRESAAGAFARLRDELYAALAGEHWIGWIHGDLWPGNILIDPDSSAFVGLIDWDKAAAHELALHDTLHLLIYTRKLVYQHGPADILAALGPGVAWTPEERSILELVSPAPATHTLTERVSVLTYWLRQTASTLTLMPWYADDRDYVALNIDGVLRQI